MKAGSKHYRTVWMKGSTVFMIDQTLLPFSLTTRQCRTYKDTCAAIRDMTVRGAGAIGAAAGYAMAQAFMSGKNIKKARLEILSARPTAQNLFYAVDRVCKAAVSSAYPSAAAIKEAQAIADEDAESCLKIGMIGEKLIKNNYSILTHCNAGWLAFVDHGTALSPIYEAKKKGKKMFVYVDETRPRGQGAKLTAWELKNQKVPHAVIPDNAAAYLMSQGKIDIVITGADRIAANGDTANKIGTLEKAIAAKEFGIPFYIAAPTSTIDKKCRSGKDIPIESRGQNEVLFQEGIDAKGKKHKVLTANPGSQALNPAFDVTPSKYITGIITEKGIIKADRSSIARILK